MQKQLKWEKTNDSFEGDEQVGALDPALEKEIAQLIRAYTAIKAGPARRSIKALVEELAAANTRKPDTGVTENE
ncbi:MAG TPA: hypothetical protein DCL54_04015 [Alphaproteobacteria bacterium]|nr:hypothetical protein [Alphaproteobacteria bacterium]